MMNKNLTIFSALIASLIYIGVVVGLIMIAVKYLGERIAELPSEWMALYVIVLFTLVFCSFLISNALKNNIEKRNQKIIQDRLGVYRRFLDTWFGEGLINTPELAPLQLTYAMCLLASDNVLKLYKKLINIQETNPHGVNEKQKILKQIILEMRRDLGQLNFAILQGDLDFIFNTVMPKSNTYSYEIEKTNTTT